MRLGRWRLRLCARCSGEAAGLVCCLVALRLARPAPSPWLLAWAALLPLPAILDWSTQAMERRESTNPLRFITGALFAAGCVLLGHAAAQGRYGLFAVGLGVLLTEGLIALRILRRSGAIERVLEPFEAYADEFVAGWRGGDCPAALGASGNGIERPLPELRSGPL